MAWTDLHSWEGITRKRSSIWELESLTVVWERNSLHCLHSRATGNLVDRLDPCHSMTWKFCRSLYLILMGKVTFKAQFLDKHLCPSFLYMTDVSRHRKWQGGCASQPGLQRKSPATFGSHWYSGAGGLMPKHTALLTRQNQTEGSGRMDTAMALFLSLQVRNIHRLKENFKRHTLCCLKQSSYKGWI